MRNPTKRYVIKSSKQLGLDEQWYQTSKRKRKITARPYWYVVDKETQQIVEGSQVLERAYAKYRADQLNLVSDAKHD